ncbi:hypothetical protein BGZ52_008705 [Haplosporangium bisporale]|nr:hypothetical protein BGZ52_008705 [Haplosporangium bisporale]KFH70703.1 hypothetical protein MVEG_03551 [Podila verticillata NRRL 6337]
MLSSKTTPGGRQTKDITALASTPTTVAAQFLSVSKRVADSINSTSRPSTSTSGKIPTLPALPTLSPLISSFNASPTSTVASTTSTKTPAQIGRSNSAKEPRGITINTSLNTTSSRPSSARKPVKYGPVSPRISTSPINSATIEVSAPKVPAPAKVLSHPLVMQGNNGSDLRSINPIAVKKSQDGIVCSNNSDQDIAVPSGGTTVTQNAHHLVAHSNVEGSRRVSITNAISNTNKNQHNGGIGGINSLAHGLHLPTPPHGNGNSTPSNKGGMSLLNVTVTSNGSSGNGSSNSAHQDGQSKCKRGFLGLKSPLMNIKKRGSDTSIKDNICTPSSPSLSTTASLKDGPLSSSSLKDNHGTCELTSPKRGLFSPASFSSSKTSHRLVYHNQHRSVRREHQDPLLGHHYHQHHQYQPSRSCFHATERELLPLHHYENEDFALWIRSATQARQVVSGVDVDDQGEVMSSGSSTHSASSSTKSDKKKLYPELEDLAILEEILDFSLIILMRASASLYPYIYGAHSKMVKVYVPWQRLQPKDRPCDPVRNARDYQSVVMGDIGEAIEIMTEIYEQEVRPFGHPDNQSRDTKQHFGPQYGTYVRPPGHLRRRSNTYSGSQHPNSASSGESKKGAMAQLLNTIGITNSNSSGTQKCLSPTTLRAMAAEMTSITHSNNSHLSTSLPLHPQLHHRPAPIQTAPVILLSQTQHQQPKEPRQHRRRSSVSIVRTSMASLGKNFMKSMPSPNILNSAPVVQPQNQSSSDGYTSASYSFLDDASMSSATSAQSMPVPMPTRQSQHVTSLHSAIEAHSSFTITSASQSSDHHHHQGSSNLSFPASLQSIFGFKSPLASTSQHSHHGHSLAGSDASPFVSSPQLSSGPILSRQEERQMKLEANWRADITHRKAALRAWCCHRFTELYEFSLSTTCSLEGEFKDLYRIISSIVDVNRTDRSHEALAWELERTRSDEQPFKLRYSQYRTVAPTSEEIDQANKTVAAEFQAVYDSVDDSNVLPPNKDAAMPDATSLHINTIPPTPRLYGPGVFSPAVSSHHHDLEHHQFDDEVSSAYDNMEFYRLQEHPLWEPLLDRITKFDSTHHSLDPRNIFQFLRRMSVDDEPLHLLSDALRNELLAVLWVIERCVRERPDFQQSPTWFRLSSSASAVQAVYRAGGILAYLKDLRAQNNGKDPILCVHPVTLTGYFKRLLKEAGGLLLKETTGLFVELVRPTTDNGDFWNLEQLSRIDRTLLFRVICLDKNRGEVFMRISRIMAMILERAPEDMELDAFALSKMVQVVELSGVLDLKALKRWNGAWSAIILGYM